MASKQRNIRCSAIFYSLRLCFRQMKLTLKPSFIAVWVALGLVSFQWATNQKRWRKLNKESLSASKTITLFLTWPGLTRPLRSLDVSCRLERDMTLPPGHSSEWSLASGLLDRLPCVGLMTILASCYPSSLPREHKLTKGKPCSFLKSQIEKQNRT